MAHMLMFIYHLVPSAGPANVIAVVLGPTNVSVSWEEVPRLDQNGLIEGYRVCIVKKIID